MIIRKLHLYVGTLIAPSVLFFAFTGALQLFNLHESHGGYHAPVLLEKLAAVHKDQRFAAKPDEDGPPDVGPAPGAGPAAGGAPHEDAGPKTSVNTWILKWVFLGVAAGLVLSTLLGLWMALSHPRQRRIALILLLVGAAAPLVILAL